MRGTCNIIMNASDSKKYGDLNQHPFQWNKHCYSFRIHNLMREDANYLLQKGHHDFTVGILNDSTNAYILTVTFFFFSPLVNLKSPAFRSERPMKLPTVIILARQYIWCTIQLQQAYKEKEKLIFVNCINLVQTTPFHSLTLTIF